MGKDWNAAKIEYMTGTATLEDISKKYEIPLSSLKKKASRDGWRKQKIAEFEKVQAEAQKQFNTASAERLVKNLDREYKIAERISELLDKATAVQIEVVTLDSDGEPCTKIDLAALNVAAKILKEIEAVKRSIGGMTTTQEDRVYNLNKERLEIERKRLERDTDEDDEGGGVLILPEVESGEADE